MVCYAQAWLKRSATVAVHEAFSSSASCTRVCAQSSMSRFCKLAQTWWSFNAIKSLACKLPYLRTLAQAAICELAQDSKLYPTCKHTFEFLTIYHQLVIFTRGGSSETFINLIYKDCEWYSIKFKELAKWSEQGKWSKKENIQNYIYIGQRSF